MSVEHDERVVARIARAYGQPVNDAVGIAGLQVISEHCLGRRQHPHAGDSAEQHRQLHGDGPVIERHERDRRQQ